MPKATPEIDRCGVQPGVIHARGCLGIPSVPQTLWFSSRFRGFSWPHPSTHSQAGPGPFSLSLPSKIPLPSLEVEPWGPGPTCHCRGANPCPPGRQSLPSS